MLQGSAAINGTGNRSDNNLIGNDAANVLSGGNGKDRLDGGKGADTLIGGAGADVFVLQQGSGSDVVTDFSKLDGDSLYFSGYKTLAAPTIAQVGSDTLISFSNGDTVKLLGVSATDPYLALAHGLRSTRPRRPPA